MSFSEFPSRAGVELSLDAYLHGHLPAGIADVQRLLGPVLEELAALHHDGRIHGGIQPAALRLSLNGDLNRERFLAFRRSEDGSIREEVPHAFRAPETFCSEGPDSRLDCYAVGALLYTVLTGSVPPPASRRAQHDAPLIHEDVPPWAGPLAELTTRCLALAREERPADAQEIQSILGSAPESSELLAMSADPSVSGGTPPAEGVAATCSDDSQALANLLPAESVAPLPDPPAADADAISAGAPAAETSTQSPDHRAAPTLPGAKKAAVSSEPHPIRMPAPAPLHSAIAARLPNASVGKPYHRSVRELFDQASRVQGLAITFPQDVGLVFDQASETIQGTPATPGEFKLALTFHLAPPTEGRPALTHEVCLTINPDPASLWQNKPSDPDGLFAKPDTDKGNLFTPQLAVIAASLRGRSHAHEGKYRDDDFAMHLVEETGWHLFIAADGAGSAKFSRRGSQIACATALARLIQWLTPGNDLDEALEKLGSSGDEANALEKLRRIAYNPLMRAAYDAFIAIGKEAEDCGATLRDFATTFVAVAVRRVGSRWFFASFAIGDGGAGVLEAPGKLRTLTRPDSGEFAGQTVFLTMPQVFQDQTALLARADAAFCDDFRFLAVMTDGITDPIFHSDSAFLSAEAWAKWEQQLAEKVDIDALAPGVEEALLQWLHFASPGNHDDRTLILAAPRKTGEFT